MAIKNFSARDILRFIAVWTIINVFFNATAQFLTENLYNGFLHIAFYFNSFFSYITFQSCYFGLILTVSACISQKKLTVLYAYSIVQFIALHLVFFYCLKTEEGVLSFITDDPGVPLKFINYSGTDISYTFGYFFPIKGLFDGGIYWPDNLERFYLLLILVPILYNFFLTWITSRVVRMLWKRNKIVISKLLL